VSCTIRHALYARSMATNVAFTSRTLGLILEVRVQDVVLVEGRAERYVLIKHYYSVS
jgi:hypothetical protein